MTFQLRQGTLGAPVGYAELARTLGVEVGERAPLADVRAAVLGLRAARAWCSTRPTTTPGAPGRSSPTRCVPGRPVPDGAPAWPQPDGLVKTSAAWLIDHAGFAKGYGTAGPAGSLSTKHTLALTNRGGATADGAAGPGPRGARRRAGGVRRSRWCNEPVLVGCEL